MIRSLGRAVERWILRLRLCFLAPLLLLLILAPALALENTSEESEAPDEEKEEEETPRKEDRLKGFFASIFPDARHLHRTKTGERWSYKETISKFIEEVQQEDAEKGEPNPYSAFEGRSHKIWRPKRKTS